MLSEATHWLTCLLSHKKACVFLTLLATSTLAIVSLAVRHLKLHKGKIYCHLGALVIGINSVTSAVSRKYSAVSREEALMSLPLCWSENFRYRLNNIHIERGNQCNCLGQSQHIFYP